MKSVFSELTCHKSNFLFGGHVTLGSNQFDSLLFNTRDDEFLGLMARDPRPGNGEDLLSPIF